MDAGEAVVFYDPVIRSECSHLFFTLGCHSLLELEDLVQEARVRIIREWSAIADRPDRYIAPIVRLSARRAVQRVVLRARRQAIPTRDFTDA